MDSLTHIAFGACIGEAFLGRQLGKKALLVGAMAQSVPDIDFLAGLWLDTAESLLAHRGFTHSIFFAVIIIPLLAMIAERWHRPRDIAIKIWILFFGLQILIHILLDGFNNYGVGWLEPFSHQRFSFNAIFVADPFFSVFSGIAFAILLILHRLHIRRKFWWMFGLILPVLYLGYCINNKIKISSDAKFIFNNQQIPHDRYFTTPSPLNNWLWYIVAGNDSGYYVGFRSLFDAKKEISLEFFPRNDSLLKPVSDHEDLQHLKRFSQQFYTVERWGDTLVFNDLRFGQIIGWHKPKEEFVFHYFLQHPEDNTLVVQRGRFSKWDWESTKSLIRRINGN